MKPFSNTPIIKKKGGQLMLTILSIFFVYILILAGVLLACSPGKAKPFLYESGKPLAGSISEKIFVSINGVEQGMFIKSKDSTNPVMLYLHGGMPDYFLTRKYPTGIEDYFTVVWWEQRGSGLSCSAGIPPETMTLEHMVSDTKTLTDYLVLRDHAMHSLGFGTTHDMKSVISGILLPSLMSPDYTLTEKVNMWLGKSRSGISILWSDILLTDLTKQVPELKIPVYFCEGKYDYTVSSILAKNYFEKLKAPLKGCYTFEKSAHNPLFEEPERMQQILREDVLSGMNNLSD